MRTAPPLVTAFLAFVVAACGKGAAAPVGEACDLKTTGPLIGYSYDVAPPAAPTGGAIDDGVYDLVKIVDHGKASGPESSDQAPAFRWALQFTTDDRSPNHVEGQLLVAIDLPPANKCETARFALVGTELRSLTKVSKLESQSYSATADGLVLETKGVSYVFHKR